MKGMKYNSIEPDLIDLYINDDNWVMEQKLDGIRCIVVSDKSGIVSFLSHTGQPLKVRQSDCQALIPDLNGFIGTFDAELMPDGSLVVFDVMSVLHENVTDRPQEYRREILNICRTNEAFTGKISVVNQAEGAVEKAALWAQVIGHGAEGVVLKHITGTYENSGTRSNWVLKCKVTRTIDCVVIDRNEGGSQNAVLALLRGNGLVRVGKCSMIGKPSASVGQVIEVEFLYVTDPNDPQLYQPRMKRMRTDKTPLDCDWGQLAGAVTDKGVLV